MCLPEICFAHRTRCADGGGFAIRYTPTLDYGRIRPPNWHCSHCRKTTPTSRACPMDAFARAVQIAPPKKENRERKQLKSDERSGKSGLACQLRASSACGFFTTHFGFASRSSAARTQRHP